MTLNQLEWLCLTYAWICALTGHYWLAFGACMIGIPLCVVDIGKRDGWL